MLPHEQDRVRAGLRYLATHLRGPHSPPWATADETFYLHVLSRCTLTTLLATFRVGVERWRYMPKPSDILHLYDELVPSMARRVMTPDSAGCQACDGTGWEVVGPRLVSPCCCPRGERIRQRRR